MALLFSFWLWVKGAPLICPIVGLMVLLLLADIYLAYRRDKNLVKRK